MYCSKCKFELPDGSVFCPKCGTKVSTLDEDNSEKREKITNPNDKRYSENNDLNNNRKKKIWILCLCIAGALALGLLFNVIYQPFIKCNLNDDVVNELFGVRWGMTKAEVKESIGRGATEFDDSIMVFSGDKTKFVFGFLVKNIYFGFSGNRLDYITVDFDAPGEKVKKEYAKRYGQSEYQSSWEGKKTMISIDEQYKTVYYRDYEEFMIGYNIFKEYWDNHR